MNGTPKKAFTWFFFTVGNKCTISLPGISEGAGDLRFDVPANGYVVDHNDTDPLHPRVEIISLGGVRSRGLWLEDGFGLYYGRGG